MGEAKVFESDGFVVTTERFVYDSQVVPLDDIDFALPFINRNWVGMFIIAGIGLAMMAWGGVFLKVIGFLLLPGSYAFLHYTVIRKLILSMKVGESMQINVETTTLLGNVVSAINQAIRNKKGAQSAALKEELGSLPTAE